MRDREAFRIPFSWISLVLAVLGYLLWFLEAMDFAAGFALLILLLIFPLAVFSGIIGFFQERKSWWVSVLGMLLGGSPWLLLLISLNGHLS